MKFQNCILINFVTDARTDGRADGRTSPSGNMPLQLFQSWGHKNGEKERMKRRKKELIKQT